MSLAWQALPLDNENRPNVRQQVKESRSAVRAPVLQFEVPAEQFRPGTYTCQINIIDSIASAVAFPRLGFVVLE